MIRYVYLRLAVCFFRLDPGLGRGKKKSRLLSRISQHTFSIFVKPIVSMQLICKVISIFPVRLHETVSEKDIPGKTGCCC